MKCYRNLLWVTLYQISSAHVDPLKKTWPPVGRAFLPYMATVQLENLVLGICLRDFNMTFYRGVLWVTLIQIPPSHFNLLKNMAACG